MISDEEYARKMKFFEAIGYKPHKSAEELHRDSHRVIQVAGGERYGKFLDILTPVPTPSGWKFLRDIQSGDYVFSDDGKPTRVTWVSEINTDEPCYRIKFDTGEDIIAGESHQWATQSEHERKNTNRKKVNRKEVRIAPPQRILDRKHSIRTTAELAVDTLITKPKTKWGSGYMANYSIPTTVPVEYPKKQLLVPPYVLGVWLGDGTTVDGTITIGDEEIISYVAECGYAVTKHSAKYRYGVKGLKTQLRIIGVLGNKHIPVDYLESSIEDRFLLLQGLMDTDGWSGSLNSQFYNTNKGLVDDVCLLLYSLGIKPFVRDKEARLNGKSCGTCYTISFNSCSPVFRLGRKRSVQKTCSQHVKNHYIRSVIPCDKVPVKCLAVESSSHLYLVGRSFIPTHNSLYAAAEGCYRMFIGDMLAGYPNDEYWLVAADYSRNRAEFDYLARFFKKLGPFIRFQSKRIDPGELIVGFKGVPYEKCIRIFTKSSSDPLKLASSAPRGIIGCEFSQVDYETKLRCMGRLAEKRGWFIMTGTFETSLGWYASDWKFWQSENKDDARSYSKPSWENKVIFPKGRNDPEILRLEGQMSRERFMERHGGVPCPPAGSVFANYFSNGIHVKDDLCFFNPEEEVYIWVDPGYTHANVVEAVQIRDGKAYLIDEIYSMGLVTGGDRGVINAFKQKEWAKNVRRGTVDVAGTQKRPEGPPIAEVWRKEAGIHLTSNKVGILEGIEVFKTFLMPNPITNEPKIYLSSKCKGLISEMGGGLNPITGRAEVWSFQVDKEGKIVGEKPKPINDDSCKAVIYGLVDMFGYATYKPMRKTRNPSPYRLVMK